MPVGVHCAVVVAVLGRGGDARRAEVPTRSCLSAFTARWSSLSSAAAATLAAPKSLRRSGQTAAPLAAALGIAPVTTDATDDAMSAIRSRRSFDYPFFPMTPSPSLARSSRGGHPPTRACGAQTRQTGLPCGRGAGWGTDHPGHGRCKLHGGRSPSGVKAAARQAACASAASMSEHAIEVEVSPSDALLYTVRRAAGLSSYYRGRLADIDPDAEPDAGRLWAGLERESLRDLARYSKMTLDAGVEERAAQLAERAGGRLTVGPSITLSSR